MESLNCQDLWVPNKIVYEVWTFVKKMMVLPRGAPCCAVWTAGWAAVRPGAENADFHRLQARGIHARLSLCALGATEFRRENATVRLQRNRCSQESDVHLHLFQMWLEILSGAYLSWKHKGDWKLFSGSDVGPLEGVQGRRLTLGALLRESSRMSVPEAGFESNVLNGSLGQLRVQIAGTTAHHLH